MQLPATAYEIENYHAKHSFLKSITFTGQTSYANQLPVVMVEPEDQTSENILDSTYNKYTHGLDMICKHLQKCDQYSKNHKFHVCIISDTLGPDEFIYDTQKDQMFDVWNV